MPEIVEVPFIEPDADEDGFIHLPPDREVRLVSETADRYVLKILGAVFDRGSCQLIQVRIRRLNIGGSPNLLENDGYSWMRVFSASKPMLELVVNPVLVPPNRGYAVVKYIGSDPDFKIRGHLHCAVLRREGEFPRAVS